MGIIKKGMNTKDAFRDYYDNLKRDAWNGRSRPGEDSRAPYIGPTGLRKQGRGAFILGGLYLLGSFRSFEPRLFTAGKYLLAPIINTTALGKAAKTATNALRTAQQLGALPSELTNNYSDIPITNNPILRVKSMFADPKAPNDIRKKYGLNYGDDRSFDPNFGDPESPDLIPVTFTGFRENGEEYHVNMRGMIAGLSDTITPTWNETMYVGRPQGVVTYGGFAREIAFDLTCAAVAPQNLRPMWDRINQLSNFVLPMADGAETRYSGRMCKVRIGDYLDKELCVMTALSITPNEEAMWEIADPSIHHPSLTLDKPFGNKVREAVQKKINKMRVAKAEKLRDLQQFEKATEVAKKVRTFPLDRKQRQYVHDQGLDTKYIMPRVCTLSISLKVLHNGVPGAKPLFNVKNPTLNLSGADIDARIAALRSRGN